MTDKAYVQTRDGTVIDVTQADARAKLESGDYLPATADDKALYDQRAAANTVAGRAKTFAERAAAGAIDAAEAPIALPLRAAAAMYGDPDPMRNISGAATVENLAGLAGGALTDRTVEQSSREYGEAARVRASENAKTAFAGNLAGSVIGGGGLAGGAKSIGSGLASALGDSAAAQAAGAVATGALEGAAYGQAGAGDESYLNNVPLSAEKLIASMGWGAILGGTVSLGAHAASGALGMLRNGSRGATPLDSPRTPGGDIGGEDIPLPPDASGEPASGTRPVAAPAGPAPQYEVNVGAFDKESMRPESAQFVRDNPEAANAKGPPQITLSPNDDGKLEPAVSDGRHRMQAAVDRGETSIDAQVIQYDADGNVVAKSVQPISLTDAGPAERRGNPSLTSIRELPPEEAPTGAAPEDMAAPVETGAAQTPPPGRISSALRDFADERTAKALGARGSTLKSLGRTAETAEATMHDMARTVRGIALDDGSPIFRATDSQEELASRVAQAKDEAGTKLAAFRTKADEIFEQHPHIAPDANAIADRIQSEIVAPLQSHPSSVVASQAKPIAVLVDDLKKLAAKSDDGVAKVSDLTLLRQGLDDQIYQTKRGVNLSQQGAPPRLMDLQKARMVLENSIEASQDKAAEYMPKGEAGRYRELKTNWRHLNIADQIAGSAQLQNLGNRVVSPTDYAAGIAGAAAGGGVAGLASAAVHHVVRERASAVAAVLADKLANTLDGKVESGLSSFFKESSQRAAAGMGKVSQASAALPSVPIRRVATAAAVDAFMGRSKDLPAAYQKRVMELANANQNMSTGVRNAVVNAMGGAGDALPQLAAAATVTATTGAQYLQSQVPSGTFAPTVFQPTRTVTPSDLQIKEFAQKWAAVANPLSVLDDLRRGAVTHAQIDAVKNVYPAMYAEIQQKALEKIREQDASGKKMAFGDRLQLDLFLDLNGAGEPTLAPTFVDHVTQLQAQDAQQQAQGGKPPVNGPNSGKGVSGIADSRKSTTQQTLGG